MIRRRTLGAAVLAAVMLQTALPARAAVWITPDWPAGKEPTFQPVPLFWFQVRQCPLVYRTEVDVPKGADRASAAVRTSGYVYVCVDGRQVYAWAPRPARRVKGKVVSPAVPPDPDKVHHVDLSEHLTPGRHVLTVSAPRGGFVLDGGFYTGTKRVAGLESSHKWTVTKFRPTTIVEAEPIMSPGYKGPAAAAAALD